MVVVVPRVAAVVSGALVVAVLRSPSSWSSSSSSSASSPLYVAVVVAVVGVGVVADVVAVAAAAVLSTVASAWRPPGRRKTDSEFRRKDWEAPKKQSVKLDSPLFDSDRGETTLDDFTFALVRLPSMSLPSPPPASPSCQKSHQQNMHKNGQSGECC